MRVPGLSSLLDEFAMRNELMIMAGKNGVIGNDECPMLDKIR